MKFRFQLQDIVRRHFNQTAEYSNYRRKNLNTDFKESLCPIVDMKNNQSFMLNFVLFSDGVSIKKSTFKKQVWPMWVQVADLPPKLRLARRNIILAALFVGDAHPDWTDLVPHIRAELVSGIEVDLNENLSFKVTFKIRLLICDLGAKSHVLNMYKFNGHYGCHYCTVQGKTIGRTHAYYLYIEEGRIRKPSLNDNYVDAAKSDNEDAIPNVVGVKAKSAFATIMTGLPSTAPIDYMHCVLLGVFPELLRLCYKQLSAHQRKQVYTSTSKLSCPREMIAYSRKIRSLDEISQFKANDIYNWFFILVQ